MTKIRQRSGRVAWRARIYHGGPQYIYLGDHPTEKEGARAYDSRAKELFKEFAKLNFPEGE